MENPIEHDAHAHPAHQKHLAQAIMKRQMALSVRIAVIFLAILLGLPLVNYYMPSLANAPIFGFTLTWLFLGILFYPVTWILSWWFIRQSNHIEADIARSLSRGKTDAASTDSGEIQH